MNKLQKKITRITSVTAALGFIIWFSFDPSFNPAIGFVITIGGILSSYTFNSRYKKKRLKGKAKFNYGNNNGVYIIGKNESAFETKWSKASNQSIHLYNDPANISGIAIADNIHQIKKIKDASDFDFSSRSRTIKKHGIAILQNVYGNFAAVKILDIKDNTRGDDTDELYFEYIINPDNKTDFS